MLSWQILSHRSITTYETKIIDTFPSSLVWKEILAGIQLPVDRSVSGVDRKGTCCRYLEHKFCTFSSPKTIFSQTPTPKNLPHPKHHPQTPKPCTNFVRPITVSKAAFCFIGIYYYGLLLLGSTTRVYVWGTCSEKKETSGKTNYWPYYFYCIHLHLMNANNNDNTHYYLFYFCVALALLTTVEWFTLPRRPIES